MCLPFSCGGGGDKGDDGSHDPSSHYQPFRQPQQPPRPQQSPPGFVTSVPAGGDGMIGGAGSGAPAQWYAPVVNKNGGGRMTAPFGNSDDNNGHPASDGGGVVRGRDSAAGKIVAPTTPATQAINKRRDHPAAQQAPQRTHVVSDSPRHNHGHGSSAASHPSEAADNMQAPLPVQPMARHYY